jgi:hypothetical protein
LLYNDECTVTTCPETTYRSDKVCLDCPSNCANCTGSAEGDCVDCLATL